MAINNIDYKLEYEELVEIYPYVRYAIRDPLTGLYNRGNFLKKIDRYAEKCQNNNEKFAVVFIGLEGLKGINDSLGHLMGDRLLIEISKRLTLLMKDNQVLSRFSGGRIGILWKSITEDDDVNAFAKTLLEQIRRPFIIESTTLNVSASIGISMFPKNGVDTQSLIRYSDIAMFKAKDQADDKICFFSKEMANEIEMKFSLTNSLVMAMDKKELAVYYQPIFDIKQEKNIMAAEALLRWNNPDLGMVPPDKFIPLAEETGQIIPIGLWVLEEVCKQINLWKCAGYELVPIAVNISVKQLEQMDFADMVIEIMKRNDIDPRYIELEITESVSTGDIATIVKNLKALKENEIKISMDDFGTGFSSLGQLDLFQLDKLKIDKIFIDDLVNVSKRKSLVKSIIAMAESLDLMVVAEGIETIEQLSYLKELGCQLGQGYLFSKPIPVEMMEKLLIRTKI